VIDVIPNSDSAEAFQSSEPSLTVNPLNTSQMLAGSFGGGTPSFRMAWRRWPQRCRF
jgi:hypothetical protein